VTGQFQLAGGSTIGRDHRMVPKNNQDSWAIWRYEDQTIAIVADGCGSGKHSEVGAKLGVQMLGAALRKEYAWHRRINWRRVQRSMLTNLDTVAQAMGGDYRKVVEDYLLFTLMGVVIDESHAVFFVLGDGSMIVNGDVVSVGPFQNNMPPYLGYGLILDELAVDEKAIALTPTLTLPATELRSFMIATDGVDDVIKNSQNALPGTAKLVGPIEQFWCDDRYFGGNPELLSRQLKLIGRDWPLARPQPGLLGDDTTIIVGRQVVPTAPQEET
jgi:hypothetical protein